ncbi:MAG TPA: DUF3347 domain-containing protein [Hanamia sp.]
MKRVLAIIFLIIILLAVWFLFFKTEKTVVNNTPTKETPSVKKHSPDFDAKMGNMINAYMAMKNAFVDGDTTEIKSKTTGFISSADRLNLEELHQTDTSVFMAAQQNLSDIKANAEPILQEKDIEEMRHDFSMVSENLYPLLKTVAYEGEKLYWQNCPMAFGDDKPANWLSNTAAIINPYLGKNHPVYKSSMLNCGENMDSIYLK